MLQTDIEDKIGRNPVNETKRATVQAERLRSIVDRIERLEAERKALSEDLKDIYVEAKGAGFDTKVLRRVVQMRKHDPAQIEQMELLLDTYWHALEG